MAAQKDRSSCVPSRHTIVGIPFERHVRVMALYPSVEHIVQEQVGQQRTDHPALRCAQRSHLCLTIGQFHRRFVRIPLIADSMAGVNYPVRRPR